MPLGALVVNRVHQAHPIPEVPPAAAERLASGGADARLLASLLEQHAALEALATAEQERIARLLDRVPSIGVVQVPLLADDVHDLAGLRRLSGQLFAPLNA